MIESCFDLVRGCSKSSLPQPSRPAKPLVGRPLRLHVTVHRFVCCNEACPRAVFAVPLSDLAPPLARTTANLAEAHTAIGFAAGGEPGARLAEVLAMSTSPDTLFRRLKAQEIDPGPPPHYVSFVD